MAELVIRMEAFAAACQAKNATDGITERYYDGVGEVNHQFYPLSSVSHPM